MIIVLFFSGSKLNDQSEKDWKEKHGKLNSVDLKRRG
jgi:hypothetical protein